MKKSLIRADQMKRLPLVWLPDYFQVSLGRTEGTPYLHSLWVGLTAPLINLPQLVWEAMLRPFFRGALTIATYTARCWFHGLRGEARGVPVPRPDRDAR